MKQNTLLFLLSTQPLQAMMDLKTEVRPAHIRVEDIQAFSAPFKHVPDYFYKHPNTSFTLEVGHDELEKRKRYAPKATRAQIEKLTQNVPAEQIVKKTAILSHGYDWIHALNLVGDWLKGSADASLAHLIALNDRLTRLTYMTKGIFRERQIVSEKRLFSETEYVFFHYLSRTPGSIQFKELESDKAHDKPFCETSEGIMTGQDRYLRVKTGNLISTESIHKLFQAFIDSQDTIKLVDTLGRPLTLNPREIEAWQEEAQLFPDYEPGYINGKTWISMRVQIFPDPQAIVPLLNAALDKARLPTLHPIEKAATLWWTILTTHCWSEGNMSTARAAAGGLLLSHGFLPPLLSEADEASIKELLVEFTSYEPAYQAFLQLIAQRIIETQETFRGEVL